MNKQTIFGIKTCLHPIKPSIVRVFCEYAAQRCYSRCREMKLNGLKILYFPCGEVIPQ
jgi:hypothetical protein